MSIEFIDGEQVSAIPGCDGYFVSKSGKIFSTKNPRHTKVLAANDNGHGYKYFCARVNGRTKHIYIHKAVLLAFVGDMPISSEEIRHLNGDTSDNRLENLAYGTRSENMKDQMNHGRFVFGELSKKSKINKETAIEIANKVRLGLSKKDIASFFGVHVGIVCKIASGETWSRDTGIRVGDIPVKRKSFKSSLTALQEKEIKRLLVDGVPQKDIAKIFECSQSLVSSINTEKRSRVVSCGGILGPKIKTSDFSNILSKFHEGETKESISKSYGVSRKYISRIISGKRRTLP